MPKFHLMHCVPNAAMHGLNGYREVIDSILWGLRQLGHEANYGLNRADPKATNIIFGAQVLPPDFQDKLPADSIVYNFEQLRSVSGIRKEIRYLARRFRVWDYTEANIAAWAELGATDVRIVPVGYAPVLTRIKPTKDQDIDVLLYGLTGAKRLEALHTLVQSGLTVVFVSGLYGKSRDELISRAKLILNVNLYDAARIFEIVRVSYLLANRKAVVACLDEGTAIESDIEPAVCRSSMETLVRDCRELLANPERRRALAEVGFDAFSKRGIVPILQAAMA